MAEAVDDGQTGFLVEPGDVAGLARVSNRFFREGRATEFRRNIQDQGRFGWEAVINTALQVVDR